MYIDLSRSLLNIVIPLGKKQTEYSTLPIHRSIVIHSVVKWDRC
jgi:hypothetical protein